MPIELVFLIGVAVLLFLCIKVKVNAFIALLSAAVVMGPLAGLSGADTVAAITGGFSSTVKSIGIVIIFGILLGNYLDEAKGTNRMAVDAVRLVGQKRASLAMAITGYLVSIPVFSDAACVILTPLVKAIHKKPASPLRCWRSACPAGCWRPTFTSRPRPARWLPPAFWASTSGRPSCTAPLPPCL